MKLMQATLSSQILDKWGIPSDGVTIASSKMQQVIDNNIGAKIDLNGNYLIDMPIILPTNTSLEINGKIKMADAIIRNVSQNVSDGNNVIYTVNANQYFKVGQTIVLTDDRYILSPTNPERRTNFGLSNYITEVYNDRIVLEYNFANSDNNGFLVSENGKVGTYNGGFKIQDVDNITITGVGELDGNYANQWSTMYAVDYKRQSEATSDGSGFGIQGVDNIDITGSDINNKLYVHSWNMHGFGSKASIDTNKKNTNGLFNNIEFDGNFEKNFLGWDWTDVDIHDIKSINGISEGDIIFYQSNTRVNIYDIYSENNGRYAVSINVGATDCTMRRVTSINNAKSLNTYQNIRLSNTNVDSIVEDITIDGGTSECYGLEINQSTNPTINRLTIFNGSYIRRALNLMGVNGANITDLDIVDITGVNVGLGYAIAMFFDGNTNVVIDGFDINNVDNVFDVFTAGQTITLKNGTINNYNTLYRNNNSAITFVNVWDAQQGIYL